MKQKIVKFALPVAGLVFAVVAVAALLLYRQNATLEAKVRELQSDPKYIASQEIRQTVEEVGKVVSLPEGEDPVVATVTDKEKLKDQPFFAKAENGDKVLIYAKARRIYLYRPGDNKLLEAAPLNIGQDAAQTEEKQPTPAPVQVQDTGEVTP